MSNLNENIEIFFIDLDGTLLDTKDSKGMRTISKRNIDAIKKQSVNKEVVISTGRMGVSVSKFLKMTGLKYAVSANGALVVDSEGNVYKDDPLSIRSVILLYDFAKKNKLCLKVDAIPWAYGVNGSLQKMLSKKFGLAPTSEYNIDLHSQYYKIVMWGKMRGRINKHVAELLEKISGISVVTSSAGWTIEITNSISTKGMGNMKVAELLGVSDKEKLLHIGDTMNDSTTIEYMRFVAMGNSEKALKRMTKFIGPSFKNSGVARILDGEYKERQ